MSPASIQACLGDASKALDWLEKAYDEHDQTLVWVKVHPRLDAVREDPRYFALLEKLGLQAGSDAEVCRGRATSAAEVGRVLSQKCPEPRRLRGKSARIGEDRIYRGRT